MAKRHIVELIDDMDGKSPAAETVEFGLDGIAYSIDLTEKRAQDLRAKLAPFVGVATRMGRFGGRPAGKGPTGGGKRTDKATLQSIREWAKREGKNVSDRGRIAQDIQDEYWASHK